MLVLDSVNKSIEIVLAAAITTNQLPVITSYADITTTTFTLGSTDTTTNSMVAVTIVAAPLAATQRQVKLVEVYNYDTMPATVYIRYNNGGTIRIMFQCVLAVGECLVYHEKTGWQITSPQGTPRLGGNVNMESMLMKGKVSDAANLTAVTAMVSGTCYCQYMGTAPKVATTINTLVNVTTLVATITWAEIAIYKGTPMLNAAVTDMVRLGWADVSAVYNTTGIKNTAVNLTINTTVGDNLWFVYGATATTPFQIRGTLADNLQSGIFQTWATRPSTTASGTSALAGAAVVPGWVYIKVN